MFMILALLALVSASTFDMSRHNRSVVVHRLFKPTSTRTLLNATRLPSTDRPVPNKTVPAKPVPQPAPAPKSLRH